MNNYHATIKLYEDCVEVVDGNAEKPSTNGTYIHIDSPMVVN